MNSSSHTDPDATLLASGSVGVGGRLVPEGLPSVEALGALLAGRQYAVEAFIGRGGMGAVYRGTQVQLERAVAIKIMRRDQDGDAEFEDRFKREALALARLNHPGIVSVIDFGEASPEYLFLVMEFVDGTDLMEIIRSREVTQAMALELLPQICDALQFAHDQGIVHRDVKPSNILLTRAGRIKIADFGLAKHLDGQHTAAHTRLGTPDYAAPEQMEPGAEVDHRADIYALGVMIYQMLTGQLPRGSWRPPSERADVASDWDRVVSRAMRPDPHERYHTATEVKTDISRITPLPAMTSEKRAAHPARPRWWIGGSAFALLSGWLGWSIWHDKPSHVPSAAVPSASVIATATKAQPFVNSLGMKFVPVPGTKVFMCIHETRRKDYAVYAAETPGVDDLWQHLNHKGVPVADGDDHPVAAVSWDDASAFCAWLSKKEGYTFRLPTEDEWNLAVVRDLEDRVHVTPQQVWHHIAKQVPWLGANDPENPPADAGNYKTTRSKFLTTAPVMSFQPNELGIYDLGGNVWEWCQDWLDAEHQAHVLRGCGWNNYGTFLYSGNRRGGEPGLRDAGPDDYERRTPGFRCVMEVDYLINTPVPAQTTASPTPVTVPTVLPAEVTKDKPFANSLGMKFVPVPGTEVLFCIHETRRQDYAAYASGREGLDIHWRDNGVPFDPKIENAALPVASVSWAEAGAFCQWLCEREHLTYRLPADREWSFAVGIGQDEAAGASPSALSELLKDVYPWGRADAPQDEVGNLADESFHSASSSGGYFKGYQDHYAGLAPVMKFKPNVWGLYDMAGNLREWVGDKDGNTYLSRGASCTETVLSRYRSSFRFTDFNGGHDWRTGFRLVLQKKTSPAPSSTAAAPAKSSSLTSQSAALLTNSLGMDFLPVPGTTVLMCVHETRKKDYAAYATATPGVSDAWKNVMHEGYPVSDGDDHPVVMVDLNEAKSFCAWLSKKEGRVYRLPTDREWSFAVGIGSLESPDELPNSLDRHNRDEYPWGTGRSLPPGAGNYGDRTGHAKIPGIVPNGMYDDHFVTTAPVKSFKPNALGLYDLGGNVFEWTSDFWDQVRFEVVLRGGGWGTWAAMLPAAARLHHSPSTRDSMCGFRCVIETPPQLAPAEEQ